MKIQMIVVGALASLGAFGANVYWSNTGTGGWETTSNWQGDALPGVADTAINNVGGTVLFTDGMEQTVKFFHTGTESGKSGHLQITGGKLTVPGAASQIGSVAGGGGSIEMTGGELHVGQLQVGARGTGSMVLSGGLVRSSDWSCIGRYPGGVGTLTVTGSGVWECAWLGLFASEQGTGTITVENGGEIRFASTNIREFVIGNQSTGVGVLRLNTGGTLKASGVNAAYATDTFILDGGTLVRMSGGDNTGFIRSTGSGNLGKFQIGPNGGVIDTSNGTQTVAINVDDLPGGASGPLVKKGTGTLVLSKGGTFTGGYTVEEGTLSVASAANLPGCTTAPITIKSGATLAISGDWTEETFTAMTNRADFVVEEGGTLIAPVAFTTDYVVSVPSGTLTLSDLNLTARLVKTGAGTLELAGYNTLAGGVVVSNGTLAANYETSGLADTHVHLAGPSTSTYCYLGIHGDSFTAPIADSGAGTFSFGPYTGIKAMDPGPFTLNVGGDGRTVKWNTGDWIFVPNGGPFTVKNVLDVNGSNNFTIKGSGSWPVVLEGGVTNTSTSAGNLNYWTGSVVVPARAGGARHESYRFLWRSGDVLITNATIHSRIDFIVGDSGSNCGLVRVTLKDCVKTTGGGWDYVNGSTGTVMTIDGGSFAARTRLTVGRSDSGRTGRLVITNNAAVTTSEFYMQSGSTDLDSGSLTAGGFTAIGDGNIAWAGRGPATFTQRGGMFTMNASGAVGSNTGSVGRVVMTGGSIFMKDGQNFQVGARGNGTFIQTGGDVSLSSYACVGRYPGGVGEYRLHGGTLTHRIPASGKNYLMFIAEQGTGTVSIANGGRLTVTNESGLKIASESMSKGTLVLSPGGTYEATTAFGGSGDDTFVFNGGTFKMFSNAKASTIIQSSVGHRVATPLGGEIDTAGKGDFTLPVALTAASRPEELAETLIHRWRFDDGSLADCVGNSDATVVGTVEWTNGAVRLHSQTTDKTATSCINLGAGVLPTSGRGATIEMWVTQLERRQWARLICAGPSKTFWLASNRGGSNKEGWLSINGTSGAASHAGYELENGKRYHMALVFEKQLDDTWLITVSMRDAATGELIDSAVATANASWSFDKIDQAGGIWLGHSADPDPDPYMDYHDVRIYNCAMTAEQLAASCAAGSEAHFYLMKKGAGMLTLSGANTYKAGTGVDGGTLTLASGAKLPATEMWAGAGATFLLNSTAQTVRELGGTGTVKGGTLSVTGTIQPGGRHAIGTLTVDGTSLQSGTLVADLAADGTSDCLAVTGTLDLSNLSLALGDAQLAEGQVYTLVTAPEITGTFHEMKVPGRWRVSVHPTKVTLAYSNGTVLMLR
ncbi:MAG: autotransporter-associated beta strand repeat-containing protein [Kiritimatiellae bacterium]|nr:autotransporter-associated beta strand repeat-containing protein [Kiritimatiellia bacterium]